MFSFPASKLTFGVVVVDVKPFARSCRFGMLGLFELAPNTLHSPGLYRYNLSSDAAFSKTLEDFLTLELITSSKRVQYSRLFSYMAAPEVVRSGYAHQSEDSVMTCRRTQEIRDEFGVICRIIVSAWS